MTGKVVSGLVLLGAGYFLVFGGQYSFLDLWRLDRDLETEVAELEAVRLEVADLEQKADSLAHDSATLERLAREHYGLIREGERLYRFVEPDSSSTDPEADQANDDGSGAGEDGLER